MFRPVRTTRPSSRTLSTKAIAEFGRIDAVVNNAQASASGVTIADHTMDQFNLAIYSGLYATYLYMQKAYPHLKETKGSVVNFCFGRRSVWQLRPVQLRRCQGGASAA